jgi:biotin-dependent carboxylase-like uncharacterized protein
MNSGLPLSLVVIDPGLQTRVVAEPRLRSRRLGVPVGGAMDRATFELANALVGNAPETPGIEFAVRGPTLRANVGLTAVILGAPFLVNVAGGCVPSGQSFAVSAGQAIEIRGTPVGMRAYLAVAGGIDSPDVLGSRGGFSPLVAGEVLKCDSRPAPLRRLDPNCPFLQASRNWTLRLLPGPQHDWFPELKDTYTVSTASDRMGIRLDGPRLTFPDREMISEPVVPGAIQITRDGQPIILGVDGQTIGGYPKIAHVIDADFDLLGRMMPGDRVHFDRINFAAAEKAWRIRCDLLDEWRTRIGISLAGV